MECCRQKPWEPSKGDGRRKDAVMDFSRGSPWKGRGSWEIVWTSNSSATLSSVSLSLCFSVSLSLCLSVSLSLCLSVSLSLCLSLTHTHSLSLTHSLAFSLSLSLSRSLSLSLSLSLFNSLSRALSLAPSLSLFLTHLLSLPLFLSQRGGGQRESERKIEWKRENESLSKNVTVISAVGAWACSHEFTSSSLDPLQLLSAPLRLRRLNFSPTDVLALRWGAALQAPSLCHSRCLCTRTRCHGWNTCLFTELQASSRPFGSLWLHRHLPMAALPLICCTESSLPSSPPSCFTTSLSDTWWRRAAWNWSPSDWDWQSATLRATRDTLRGVLQMHLTDMASPSQAYGVMMVLWQ